MNESPEGQPTNNENDSAAGRERMTDVVSEQEERKIRARRQGDRGIWFGLGMYGLVGWSVAIPTVIGIAVGIWVDGRYDTKTSWTLTLLFVGLVIGCLNAWYWLKREGHFD